MPYAKSVGESAAKINVEAFHNITISLHNQVHCTQMSKYKDAFYVKFYSDFSGEISLMLY